MHVRFEACETRSSTRFLALDKIVPGREFLEILELPYRAGDLMLDREWFGLPEDLKPPAWQPDDLQAGFSYLSSPVLRHNSFSSSLESCLLHQLEQRTWLRSEAFSVSI
jgi:hypothetical protein